MASSGFAQLPARTTLTVKPFEFRANDADLKLMYDLIKLSPVGAAVWENTSTEQGETYLSNPARKLGMRHDWLSAAKEHWANKFDWRESEARINAYPNYAVSLNDEDGVPFTIHFIALFSKRDDAIPLAFYHGWPGSFLEFFGILDILMSRYTPETLPYHIIVPSLPGYAFSSGPPANVDFTIEKAADLLHRLILGLGFKSYLSQGGDIGSAVASQQAARFEECKSAHLNMFSLPEFVDRTKQDGFTALEQKAALRGKEFRDTGIAYAIEHGTRTATIGLALSASPVALLAWIGEKFLEWSDEDPPVDKILEDVSLYWLTNTMPRCIYPYRDMKRRTARIEKPFGFSFFPKEIMPTPKAWVEQAGNLQYYYSHESGGHFAALEKPDVLLADVEDWISKVWHD